MRVSISQLAWQPADNEAVAALLRANGVDAIDAAPGKCFASLADATPAAIAGVKNWWLSRGISFTGMQSLLFGTQGLNLFADAATQGRMLAHLETVARISAGLGADKLVFGSPKNRDRGHLSDGETMTSAVDFFSRLGDIGARHGVIFCLEPNPACYGANFMMSSAETAAVVKAVSHDCIKMQLDTGSLAINGEDAASVITQYQSLIGHVHASEPALAVLGDGTASHAEAARALRNYLPGAVVAIEMLPPEKEPALTAIERALQLAVKVYGQGGQ